MEPVVQLMNSTLYVQKAAPHCCFMVGQEEDDVRVVKGAMEKKIMERRQLFNHLKGCAEEGGGGGKRRGGEKDMCMTERSVEGRRERVRGDVRESRREERSIQRGEWYTSVSDKIRDEHRKHKEEMKCKIVIDSEEERLFGDRRSERREKHESRMIEQMRAERCHEDRERRGRGGMRRGGEHGLMRGEREGEREEGREEESEEEREDRDRVGEDCDDDESDVLGGYGGMNIIERRAEQQNMLNKYFIQQTQQQQKQQQHPNQFF
eukprot:GHVQ01026715.1.p1 GENE.GHVQ01026715.1~~GHVQ01026715.1.p1  ORF type:complete len:264 (+),score=100.67 GHVQ01026715.1:589-1380(+)